MRKFVLHINRGVVSILEVEAEKISNVEAPVGLQDGEWAVRVIAPKSLYDVDAHGKEIPPVFMWHSIYDTSEACLQDYKDKLHPSLLRDKRKHNPGKEVSVSEEELEGLISQIKIVKL